MTLAATPPQVCPSRRPALADAEVSRRFFHAWQLLPVVLVALVAFLLLTPDDIAEPMQDLAGWLVIGGVATLAVMAIVTGLDRLLDCDGN
jgi:hypothetical protein